MSFADVLASLLETKRLANTHETKHIKGYAVNLTLPRYWHEEESFEAVKKSQIRDVVRHSLKLYNEGDIDKELLDLIAKLAMQVEISRDLENKLERRIQRFS